MDNLSDNRLPVIQILEKASLNEFYAERLADLVESQGLLEAPANLKSSILARSSQMDVRLMARSNKLSKKLALWYYGLKVTLAAACCVGFILSAPDMHHRYVLSRNDSDYKPIRMETYERIREFQEKVGDFSKQFWETEVSFYDEQEK